MKGGRILFDVQEFLNGLIENLVKIIVKALKKSVLSNIDAIQLSFFSNLDTIQDTVAQTPESFNGTINSLVHTISDTVVLPVGIMILTFVSCYELLQMLIQKNNYHEIEMYDIWKVMFKMGAGVYILNHSYDITMSFFDVASVMTTSVAGLVSRMSSASSTSFDALNASVNAMDDSGTTVITLIALIIITFILRFAMIIIAMYCLVIVYARFIEVYITCSIAPFPIATMINRDWGHMGKSYIMNLCALAFQTFFMMVVCGMYVGLMSGFTMADSLDIYYQLLGILGSTVLLVLSLGKTKEISRQIFAH
jgi:hypothetical protein